MPALFAVAALTHTVQAHFGLDYPSWRNDSFEDPWNQALAPSQLTWYDTSGAGIGPNGTFNRTEWPLDGGSIVLALHHPWTYVYINIGLGSAVTTFNYSLTPNILNVTSNGTLCLPKLNLPSNLMPTDGQNASIQVVTGGRSGAALYNCADIVFRSNAEVLTAGQGECVNTTTGATIVVQDQATLANTTAGGDKPSSAVHEYSVPMTAAFTVLMAMLVASGLL
ncbi:hypothetical protein Dda_6058 [Drechslerella dactyloides]|uniref:Copper acquisition factor BIM1-like domain-containing protein n=1 Tax=Drechslerella dactyloides TaxID=74499 RepID=A0AAD6IUW7_DREDA|nr:hypothetical protein Dda_6058 [Drechslerella dactyloides]